MRRMLVVESVEVHKQAIRDILSREGFEIVEVPDGQRAIGAVRSSGPFDIVYIADRMPGLSGNDTLIAIRKHDPKQKVVMLMAREDRQTALLSMSRGASDILKKPFKSEEVIRTTRNILEKSDLQRDSRKKFERLRLLEKHTEGLTSIAMEEYLPEEIVREDKFLKKTLELIADVLEAKKVSIMLLDRKGANLNMAQSNWMSPEIMNTIRQPVSKGVTGWVVRERKPVLVENVHEDRRMKTARFSKQYDSPSFICTPLFLNKKVVGTISANDKKDGKPFNEEDLTVLSTFTHLVSMEIASLSMNRKVEREHLKLTYINNVVFSMTSSLGPEEIHQSMVDRIRTNLRAKVCALFSVGERGDQVKIEAVSADDDLPIRSESFNPRSGIIGKVLEHEKPIVVNNASGNDGIDPTVDFLGGLAPVNIAAVPLKLKGNTIGIILVYDKEDDLPFNKWDLEILTALAPHASMGLKNAWLYQNLLDSIDEVVATNKQLEEANKNIKEQIEELNRLKDKVSG
ncbi:GAF domain-containing protein [bacterium]|nr:MAG: GAF domain-containing protein [bacterium]